MKAIIIILLILIPVVASMISGASVDSMTPGLVMGIAMDVFILAAGVRIVKQNTVQLVELLGKFNRILRPGFNVIIPFLESTKTQVLFKQNRQIFVDGLTGDNVTVKVGLNVIYYVEDDGENIFKSVYEINDPEILIRATIDEQLRSMITEFTHKDIFTKRDEIGHTISANLKIKLSQFGYTLDSIQVQDIQLDGHVLAALNKIIETEKLKEAALNEAEAKKIRIVKEAEADKEYKKLIGEGMANQRKAIAEGFKESVQLIKDSDSSLDGEKVLKFLLDSARIETLEKIGKENTKVVYLNENLEGNSRVEKLLS